VLPYPTRWADRSTRRARSLRGDVDLDRPRLGLFPQRNANGEDAILVLGRDPVRIHGLRQRERTAEGAVAPLDVVVLLVLDVGRRLLLTADRQHEVLDADVDALARHRGELGLQHDLLIAGLEDVDWRHPGVRRGKPKVPKRIPTNDRHDLLLLDRRARRAQGAAGEGRSGPSPPAHGPIGPTGLSVTWSPRTPRRPLLRLSHRFRPCCPTPAPGGVCRVAR